MGFSSMSVLSISVDHLFQRLFEHLVASGVDERIQTRVDKTNHSEQIQIYVFGCCDLFYIQNIFYGWGICRSIIRIIINKQYVVALVVYVHWHGAQKGVNMSETVLKVYKIVD